jgi:hypothetical protein
MITGVILSSNVISSLYLQGAYSIRVTQSELIPLSQFINCNMATC